MRTATLPNNEDEDDHDKGRRRWGGPHRKEVSTSPRRARRPSTTAEAPAARPERVSLGMSLGTGLVVSAVPRGRAGNSRESAAKSGRSSCRRHLCFFVFFPARCVVLEACVKRSRVLAESIRMGFEEDGERCASSIIQGVCGRHNLWSPARDSGNEPGLRSGPMVSVSPAVHHNISTIMLALTCLFRGSSQRRFPKPDGGRGVVCRAPRVAATKGWSAPWERLLGSASRRLRTPPLPIGLNGTRSRGSQALNPRLCPLCPPAKVPGPQTCVVGPGPSVLLGPRSCI